MCAIVGIVSSSPVNQDLYDALTALQHRGQDAAGMVTWDGERLHQRKDRGLVRDVFHTRHMRALRGSMGIGHVRYPTAGRDSSAEAQPFYVNSPYGITLAHNGNLVNADELKLSIFRDGLRHVNTDSDSEILLNVFAHELQRRGRLRIDESDVFAAVAGVHARCVGAYAVVGMINGYGLFAFRDPYAIRPACLGARETARGTEYVVASESAALDSLGFHLLRDLEPGEAVYIDTRGRLFSRQCARAPLYSPCIFEYVYLARPDSIVDDVSVYKARLRFGEHLADKILREWPHHDIDVVIPIPDTSRTACLPVQYKLGIKHREGFIKNRYIGRTFIMPGQEQRERSVRQKLNPIGLEFVGKNVLLVDDSIVRGTTSAQIIQMARDAGAKKVYFASAAPPVRYQNVYGIDMPVTSELVAHRRSVREVAARIRADRLIYQDLPDLVSAVRVGNPRIGRFETSIFTGEYVTGAVTGSYLEGLAGRRRDCVRARRGAVSEETMEVHNAK